MPATFIELKGLPLISKQDTTPRRIIPIVEGDGEITAVPELIRRFLHEKLSEYIITVRSPMRLRRNQIDQKLPGFLHMAQRDEGCKAIIVIMDSDTKCAKDEALHISEVVRQHNVYVPVAVVCPSVEYEVWFIASIETIQDQPIGKRGIVITVSTNRDMEEVETPEGIGSPKGWLKRHMPKTMTYNPTQDQAALTARIDFELASERSRSFRRLCHAVEQIVEGIRSESAGVTP